MSHKDVLNEIGDGKAVQEQLCNTFESECAVLRIEDLIDSV